jgi:hypothetical protein
MSIEYALVSMCTDVLLSDGCLSTAGRSLNQKLIN